MRRSTPFLALFLALAAAPRSQAAAVGPIGTNQRTLVICVRYTDSAATRLANCADWVTLLNTQLNTFFNQATFNQTNFQFQTVGGAGAPANGWLDLGYATSSYNFFTTGQDAINLADPFVDFSQFNRVAVVTNFSGFGGQGGGPWWWRVGEGAEATINGNGSRLMTLSIVNEWIGAWGTAPFDAAAAVIGHELGHHLGAPTHYGDITIAPGSVRDSITPWDIMGLSPTLNHFLGYAKTHRGWVPNSGPRTQTVGPPSGANIDTTITLLPLEQTTAGTQVIRIPFGSSGPFVGYLVENRRQIDGDQALPAQGVLLTGIDESPNAFIGSYVLDDPTAPGNLGAAPLDVGGAYNDAQRNLTVSVLSQAGDTYNVRVQYPLPAPTAPDPAITPWGAPPWETPDIWIDSSRNGWGTYRYTDASGNPTGNGDDAWVNHDNRLMIRVRNLGPGAATNVKAQVFGNSPPGMGDAGPNWDFLGNVVFATIPGMGNATAHVNWRPTVAAHTCVKVVIQNTLGELLASNNLAQENVTAFDTSPSSPYEPVVLHANVFNPFTDRELPIRMNVRDVPLGWGIVLSRESFVLPKGGREPVTFMVFPSGMPPHRKDDDRLRPGLIAVPKLEALMPLHDTWVPIGGIDVWTHLVRRTALTCHLRGTRREGREPALAPSSTQSAPQASPMDPADATRKEPGVALKLTPDQLADIAPRVQRPEPIPQISRRTLVLEGELTPPTAGAIIAVEFRKGAGQNLVYAKTDGRGHYEARFDAPTRGEWVAQSFFAGDTILGAAESNPCRVIVAPKR